MYYIEMRFRGDSKWQRVPKPFSYLASAEKNAAAIKSSGYPARVTTEQGEIVDDKPEERTVEEITKEEAK